jgi:YYY domain-containing protein
MLLLPTCTWWLLIQILGLAALPLAYRLFRWLPGRGYAFAKPLGLLLTSYVLWLGASLGYLHNTAGGAVVAIAVTAGLSLWFYARSKDETAPSLAAFIREHWRLILMVEILFAAAFSAWVGLRAYAPDKIMSSGGEKFMEIAFLNAILRSPRFPPHDPWLSGFAISYYYFGYVMMALLTQLSGVVSGIGFELYDALVFALTITGAFGVCYNLVAAQRDRSSGDQAWRYGLVGSLFVAIMGNLEGLLEALYAKGILPDRFWHWIDIPDLIQAGRVTGSWYPGHGWWWWRASRVLRDRNLLGEPTPLNPIDEFPFFSFLLGDNHPHVLALPFVLLAIALALNLMRRQGLWQERLHKQQGTTSTDKHQSAPWNLERYCLEGDWALFAIYALALGALGFLNTWDFPMYLGLAVLAYGAGRHAGTDDTPGETVQRMIGLGVSLAVAGALLYLPFYISFSSQAGGVLPYLLPPTRLAQYFVMFGPFLFVAGWFLVTGLVTREDIARTWGSVVGAWGIVAGAPVVLVGLGMALLMLAEPGRQFVQGILSDPQIRQVVGNGGPGSAFRAIILARLRDPWLFLVLSLLIALAAVSILRTHKMQREPDQPAGSKLFASLLFLCGLGLTFIVEFVYLRDSFGVRMNTIFKFYYQAWVMLGCASAYGVWWMLNGVNTGIDRTVRTVFLAGMALLTAASLLYPVLASYSRVDGLRHKPTLDGAANIARAHPDDWAAIQWLRDNAQDVSVILEAPGRSYNYEGRVSAFTGLPAVLGWALHEGQWRGNYVEQGKREPDIETIYTTPDAQQALDLLSKWEVDTVIMGPPERRFIEEQCNASQGQCSIAEAERKFDRVLEPVFRQGQTTVYRVPQKQ